MLTLPVMSGDQTSNDIQSRSVLLQGLTQQKYDKEKKSKNRERNKSSQKLIYWKSEVPWVPRGLPKNLQKFIK